MRPRCGLRAINSGTEFDDIQIEFHDAAFGEHELDIERERDFKRFADIAATGPEEQVFGELHAERAGAAARAAFERFFELGLIGLDIKAPMGTEGVVLGGDHEFGERRGHILKRCPVFAEAFAFKQADHHQGCEWRGHEAVGEQDHQRAEGKDKEEARKIGQSACPESAKGFYHWVLPSFRSGTVLAVSGVVCDPLRGSFEISKVVAFMARRVHFHQGKH